MSLESARDFLKKIDTDPALKERLEAAADLEARRRMANVPDCKKKFFHGENTVLPEPFFSITNQ
jgi:hypothetical protein